MEHHYMEQNEKMFYKPGDIVSVTNKSPEILGAHKFLIVSQSQSGYYAYPIYQSIKSYYKPHQYLKICQHTYYTEPTNYYQYISCHNFTVLDPSLIQDKNDEINSRDINEIEKRIKLCERFDKEGRIYPKFDRKLSYSPGDVVIYKSKEWLIISGGDGEKLKCILIKDTPSIFSIPIHIKEKEKHAIYSYEITISNREVNKLFWIADEATTNKIRAERISKKRDISELETKEASLKMKDKLDNPNWIYPIGTILEDIYENKVMYITTANDNVHYLLDVEWYDKGKINIICKYRLDAYKRFDRILPKFYIEVLTHMEKISKYKQKKVYSDLIKLAEIEIEKEIKSSLPRRKISERNRRLDNV